MYNIYIYIIIYTYIYEIYIYMYIYTHIYIYILCLLLFLTNIIKTGEENLLLRSFKPKKSLAEFVSWGLKPQKTNEGNSPETNGWNLKHSSLGKGKSSEPNLHDFRFQPLVFRGCTKIKGFNCFNSPLFGS